MRESAREQITFTNGVIASLRTQHKLELIYLVC